MSEVAEKTYDDTDRGVSFKPKNYQSLHSTGKINMVGEDYQSCILKETQKDGKLRLDVYIKVGALWENDKGENQSRPDFSGTINQLQFALKRKLASWIGVFGEDQRYFQLKITDNPNEEYKDQF